MVGSGRHRSYLLKNDYRFIFQCQMLNDNVKVWRFDFLGKKNNDIILDYTYYKKNAFQ